MSALTALEIYKKKHQFLKDKRVSYESNWKDIRDYLFPAHGFFEGDQPDKKRSDKYAKVIDPTAAICLRIFAAGIRAGMNNPASRWFKLESSDPDKNKYEPFKDYFERVEMQLYKQLAKGGYYNATYNIYLEEGSFGTGCLFMSPDWENVITFSAATAGEYWIDNGPDGRVNTLHRGIWMTARNMEKMFGKDKLSTPVINALENNDIFKMFYVIQIIEPREDRDVTRIDVLNMQYKSVYYEPGNAQDILGESGYYYKPMAVPRWDLVGPYAWGDGPGDEILRQTKMLQEMNMSKLKAEHLRTDPPVVGPTSLRKKGMNTLPGGKNYVDSDKPSQFGPLFNVNYDPASAVEGINDVRQIIERSLYTDLFIMMLEKPNMTATEIIERKEEKMFALGPAVTKQTTELHEPAIEFAYECALRRGLLPPAPPELEGEELKIEYVSSLAMAQKLSDFQRVKAYINVGLELGSVRPDALDKLDVDNIMDEIANMTGISFKCNHSAEEVAAIREARAQQEQAMMEMEQQSAQAQNMKTLSQADLEGKNALSQLKEAEA